MLRTKSRNSRTAQLLVSLDKFLFSYSLFLAIGVTSTGLGGWTSKRANSSLATHRPSLAMEVDEDS